MESYVGLKTSFRQVSGWRKLPQIFMALVDQFYGFTQASPVEILEQEVIPETGQIVLTIRNPQGQIGYVNPGELILP